MVSNANPNMPFIPTTLEGRMTWLLTIAALVLGGVGIGMLLRRGGESFATMPSACLLFPFGILARQIIGPAQGGWIAVLFLQFPVYAGALTVGGVRGRLRPTAVALFVVHCVAAVLCLFMR